MTAKFEDERHIHEHDWQAPSDDPQDQAIRKLAVNLIEQARADLRGGVVSGKWRTGFQQEARDFLTGATPEWRNMLEEWCEVIDWDPEVLVADAKAGCLEPMIGQRQVARMPRRHDEKGSGSNGNGHRNDWGFQNG